MGKATVRLDRTYAVFAEVVHEGPALRRVWPATGHKAVARRRTEAVLDVGAREQCALRCLPFQQASSHGQRGSGLGAHSISCEVDRVKTHELIQVWRVHEAVPVRLDLWPKIVHRDEQDVLKAAPCSPRRERRRRRRR